MPRPAPRDIQRSYRDRVNSIFKKASELHGIDNGIRIAIFIEKPGNIPRVFTVEEHGLTWPCDAQQFKNQYHPSIRRPSHFFSMNEGIEKGKVKMVELSPPPP
ncbi:hypothetical protein BS50DRAFT_443899, partial [Corynespora cassiicola Philippines]